MRTRKVRIKSELRLNVFDSGSRKNRQVKTVIFIHGGAGCLLNWKNQLPYFAEKYRTIAYDWRGCGDSDEAKSYTFDDHYDDFLSLLRLLEIPPRPKLEIIEKAGHFVPFEASEHFNNLVEGFISK